MEKASIVAASISVTYMAHNTLISAFSFISCIFQNRKNTHLDENIFL